MPSNWQYGGQYINLLNQMIARQRAQEGSQNSWESGWVDRTDTSENNPSAVLSQLMAPQGRPDYLRQRATQDRFASDEIMRRMGITSLPNSPYAWVMGLGSLDEQRLQDLMAQGVVRRETEMAGDSSDEVLSLNYAALPQIFGMSAEDFTRYDPDLTRVRDQRMVFNDPNYGLVTLGSNVIQPRDTGVAGFLPMVAQYAMGQLNPVLSIAWQAMNAASARSNAELEREQLSRFANAMQQRQNSNVQSGNKGRNLLAQMMLLGRLGNQNRGLLGRISGMRG